MTRTITAMFDSRSDAEAARAQLATSSGVSNVQIHDQTSAGATSSQGYSTHQDRGFWAEVKSIFLPDEDRHTYEEGVRRGGAVLTAEVDETGADEAYRILDNANSVDLDQRTSEWRQSGWDYQAPKAGAGTYQAAGGLNQTGTTRGATTGTSNIEEERIPITEEQLRVGKREVERGGVRVRSYVVEQPVHEQVTLRDEHVSVERRAVDQPISASQDAFQERSIEMTERAEEAVVAKEARIREELVIRKEVAEHVEDVNETVRRTEVEVDNDSNRTSTDRVLQRD